MASECTVLRWLPAVRRRERGQVDGSEHDGDDSRDRCHGETAEQNVSSATGQQHPRRARTEIRNGQDATGEVVRSEKGRIPGGALSRSLARGRDGEQRKADGPQRLLSGGPPQQGTKEKECERGRQECRRDRRHCIRDGGNIRTLVVRYNRDAL